MAEPPTFSAEFYGLNPEFGGNVCLPALARMLVTWKNHRDPGRIELPTSLGLRNDAHATLL